MLRFSKTIGALNYFVLIERALVLQGAWQMIIVGALLHETFDRAAALMTKATLDAHRLLVGGLHVDERARHRLIHLVGPQGTIQMTPFAHVHCEQATRAVVVQIANQIAEHANTFIGA